MDAFLRDAPSALRRAMTADDNGRAWAWGGSAVADEGAGGVGAQGQDIFCRQGYLRSHGHWELKNPVAAETDATAGRNLLANLTRRQC